VQHASATGSLGRRRGDLAACLRRGDLRCRRFVQGGGCTTVGVAGLIQSGGFGSFSKNYGTAAASLIEAEVVTADGEVRIANACTNPDLFWALKGGGGGSFGVVTRLTLKTYELAERAGAAIFTVKAMSGPAFRALIGKFISFYTEQLFNPHWGGRIAFPPYETLSVGMVSYGLDKAAAQAVWQPFLDWIAAAPQDYRLAAKPTIADMPARKWWDAEFRKKYAADSIVSDPRPGANPRDFFLCQRPRRDRCILARLRDAVATGFAAPGRPAAATCRRAIRGQPALFFRDPVRQRIGGRAG